MKTPEQIAARRGEICRRLQAVGSCQEEESRKPMKDQDSRYLAFLNREKSALEAARTELDWLISEDQ